jgi:hypothetical protein
MREMTHHIFLAQKAGLWQVDCFDPPLVCSFSTQRSRLFHPHHICKAIIEMSDCVSPPPYGLTDLSFLGPDAKFIAVVGVVGFFIQRFLGDGNDVPTSNSRASVIQAIELYVRCWEKGTIVLIDTSGFGDPNKRDAQSLSNLVCYLQDLYEKGRNISGIVYLHDITRCRIEPPEEKILTLLRALVGEANYDAISLVTNRWSNPSKAAEEENEENFRADKDIQELISGGKGARIIAHDNSLSSANAIVETLASRPHIRSLQIQDELRKGMALHKTTAGRKLLALWQSLRDERHKDHKDRDKAVANLKPGPAKDVILEQKAAEKRQLKSEIKELESMGDVKKMRKSRGEVTAVVTAVGTAVGAVGGVIGGAAAVATAHGAGAAAATGAVTVVKVFLIAAGGVLCNVM